MNKLIKNNMLPLLCLLAGLFPVSCNLDLNPYNGIATREAWQTVDDAERFRNGLYSNYRKVQGGRYMYSDLQTDQFNATLGFGNNIGDLHTWDFSNTQYDIEAFWQVNYIVINNANNIINNIDMVETETEEETATLSSIKGEALFIRALSYHAMLLRFAKDYEPSTATTDLGLPLVTKENDVDNMPARAALQETYDFIKEDIDKAEKLIPGQKTETGRLSIHALNLFKARIDLYMHNYKDAISNAAKVIPNFNLITTEDGLKNMWLTDTGSEIIFQPEMNADDRGNEMWWYTFFSTGTSTYSPYYIPAQWVIDLYEPSDIRLNASFLVTTVTSTDVRNDDVFLLYKYPGNPQLKRTTNENVYYNKIKNFRVAEALLISAEAAYMDGQGAGTVLGYLNTLRKARGASDITGLSGENLLREIKNEWTREYIGEAMRLDQLKRWHEGFTRHMHQNKTVVLDGEKFTRLAIEADNPKFVWEIPYNDLVVNPNLERNW